MKEESLETSSVTSAVIQDISSIAIRDHILPLKDLAIVAPSSELFDGSDDIVTLKHHTENEIGPTIVVSPEQEETNGNHFHQVFINLSSGAMAGALAKTTIAPFDRTKIFFQVTQRKFSMATAGGFIIERYRKEGFFSLWRGNTATLARIIPYAAVQFASHEQWKKILEIDKPNTVTPSWLRFFAGSLAGVTSQAMTYPLDLARARMAVTSRCVYSSLSQVFIKIWRKEGFLGFYRGLTPTVLGVIPYAGTSFGIYESLKNYHKKQKNNEQPNPLERMMFGAVAGLCGQSSSYPLDIARRRMQTANVTGNENVYTSIWRTLLTVYREEGIAHGLYKGLSLNWIKGPISVGISLSTFDTVKQLLEWTFIAKDS